jgi:molybdopterin-biosynthesis enzyme MoeA-like protein
LPALQEWVRLDEELHEQIGNISRAADRLGRPYVDFEAGVRKQATIPEGAHSLGLAGTAPGLVLEQGDTVIVVLPGPPVELQRLWRNALESEPVRALLVRTKPPELRRLRFFGVSESTVAKALADAGGDGDGVGPRSAPATSRSTSTSSSSPAKRPVRTSSRSGSSHRWNATLQPRRAAIESWCSISAASAA